MEGIKDDIVPLTCLMLERMGHETCYKNESPYKKTIDVIFRLEEGHESGIWRPQEIRREDVPVSDFEGVLQFYNDFGYYMTSPKEKMELLVNPSDIVRGIIESEPDLVVVCNARGYFPVLEHYSNSAEADMPLLVLTGGGPMMIDKVNKYTSHILPVPQNENKEIQEKIEEIFE